MTDANPAHTPADVKPLSKDQCPKTQEERDEMRRIPYREAIGSLLYASLATRPDIAFAVNQAVRYVSDPGRAHWTAVKRIFRYLKGTKEFGIMYRRLGEEGHDLVAFSDADWAGNRDNRRSTSGFICLLHDGPVNWLSASQKCVALSTHESETIAGSVSASELIHLGMLRSEMTPGETHHTPTLALDNQGTLDSAHAPMLVPRAKHVDIRTHFLAEKIAEGKIEAVKGRKREPG
jgi:hypothetical protein